MPKIDPIPLRDKIFEPWHKELNRFAFMDRWRPLQNVVIQRRSCCVIRGRPDFSVVEETG
jgi:hypothetical protein